MIDWYFKDEQAGIYIACGDCREILPQLEPVDLTITSPPYNLYKKWWDSGANGDQAHKDLAAKFTNEWYPDERPEPEYQEEQRHLLTIARGITRGSVCYNHKVRYAYKRAGAAFHPITWLQEFPLWVEIIWVKGGGPALNCRRPIVEDERIFVLGKPKTWHNLHYTSVWRIPPDNEATGHPCAFPVELPARLIGMFTNPGDAILDYYMGSGTTLVAAKQLGRKAIGIEISENYCEIAVNRLRQSVFNFEPMEPKPKQQQVLL